MAKSNISTRKKVGCSITIAVAALLIIFAFCGRFFNSALKDVANFFVGSFGMAFYGMMIALICVCSFVLAGKTIRIPAKYVAHFILLFVETVMLVHMFSTLFVYNYCASFSEYVSYVYNYYSGVPTFGGIVFGSVVYGLQSVITIYAAAFLLFGLLAWSVIVTGDFFYSYFTGKLSLSQKRKEEQLITETPAQNKPATPEVEDERSRALKILFSNDEHSLNTEEVGSAEVLGTAQQSRLDSRNVTRTREEAESILFSGAGDDFYSTTNTTQNNADDEIVLNTFFTQPTQTKIFDDSSSWRITKTETPVVQSNVEQSKETVVAPVVETPVQSAEEDIAPKTEVKTTPKKREMPKGEWVVPVVEEKQEQKRVDIVEVVSQDEDDVVATPVVTKTEQPKETIVTPVVKQTPVQPVETAQPVAQQPVQQTVKPVTVQENVQDEDPNEIVAIEKNKIVPGGVQIGYDFATKAEVREAEQNMHQYADYVRPPLELLQEPVVVEDTEAEFRALAAQAIVNKLAVFGIKIELVDQIVGPTVTQYRFKVLSERTRMDDFVRYSNDLKACLQAKADIRIEAPIMGTNLVGIEAPNKNRSKVMLRSLLESDTFKNKKGELVFPLGQEISGEVLVGDLAKLPHLLVAGTTGSGKSFFLHSLIVSLMCQYGPEYLRFIMVDPKLVELSRYNGAPHMLTSESITSPADALVAMDYLTSEMEARYQLFKQNRVGSITEYNAKINTKLVQRMPYLVLIVDELADLMGTCGKSFEGKLQRIAQKARAAGIHMILATQRPDVKTITGTIKANLPARVALAVSSPADSMTILSGGGAEKLLGRGDMLYLDPSKAGFTRAQGAFIDIEGGELDNFVSYITSTNEVYYDEKIAEQIFASRNQPEETDVVVEKSDSDNEEKLDPYCKKALRFWLERQGGRASIASIQRALKIGFNRAGRIMDSLQKLHYVEEVAASESGSKPVKVLVTLEELDELFPDMED